MLSNTDRPTLQEPEAEAAITQAEATALSAEVINPKSKGQDPKSLGGKIVRAAIILMAGTILSRMLGLGREVVIADLFGGGAEVDAFTIANHVATIVYDLLIAGTVSAALVPVFSEYAAEGKDRREFGRIVSSILTVAAMFLFLSVALLELFAEPLVGFMGAGYKGDTQALALVMTQWVLPGVFFMGLSGVVMAVHYSLGRFVYPAFTSAVFNASIMFSALVLAGLLGVKSLVLGMVIGAFGMLTLQVPGLRGVPLRPIIDWKHPAVRRIFKLYAPVGLSVIVSSAALIIDRNLASKTGVGTIAAMRFATTLIQFGLGLVSAAISLAALPYLSQHFSRGDNEAYKRTLAAGFRMVTVLVLPAAAGLMALAVPIVGLVFRHGAYTAADQNLTVLALLFYAPGLPFSAVDQVLIFAFYARKNTWTPVLVGIAAAGVYLTIALSTVGTLGMVGLVIANSIQFIFHVLVTGTLLWRVLRTEGSLRGYDIGSTTLKAGGAAVLMALVSYGVWRTLETIVRPGSTLNEAILLGIPALIGGGLYLTLIWMMRLPELTMITSKIQSRLKR